MHLFNIISILIIFFFQKKGSIIGSISLGTITIFPMMFCVVYFTVTIIWYRESTSVAQSVIVLLIHPIITEIIGTFLKLNMGNGKHTHIFYDHLSTLSLSLSLFNIYHSLSFSLSLSLIHTHTYTLSHSITHLHTRTLSLIS